MPLIHRRVIQGDPIRMGQREIVPEAQVTWWLKRTATISMDSVGGWGAGAVSIQPRALVERGPEGDRRILIHDETARMLWGLAAGAILVWFLTEVAMRLAANQGGKR